VNCPAGVYVVMNLVHHPVLWVAHYLNKSSIEKLVGGAIAAVAAAAVAAAAVVLLLFSFHLIQISSG